MIYSGIALFNQSILEQRGFGADTYHQVMGIGRAVLAASWLILPYVHSFAHVAIHASLMGAAGGVVTVVFLSVWGQVFGRTHLGRIQGCAQMMTVFASAVGPLPLAETLKRTGSYESIFLLLAALTVALGIASWRVRLPAR